MPRTSLNRACPLIAGFTMALNAASLHAGALTSILPDDGAPDAAFGCAIDLDGGVVVVGSSGDSANGPDSGSAYLFDAVTGKQLHKLTPSDGAAGDLFGCAVSIEGGIVVVAATGDDDQGDGAGAVYLFDAATGTQLQKLVASDGAAGDEFGFDVDSHNGTIVIGAKRDDDLGQDSGSAYLFDAESGQELDKLTAGDGTTNDNFGGAVAIDNGRVVIGAHAKWNGAMFLAGAAYVFDVQSGAELHKLLPSDAATNDFFGSAVAMEDDLIVVGAWAKSIVFDHSGAAYRFNAATGDQIGTRLVPADSADRDNFGRALAVRDGVIAVAAPGDSDQAFEAGSIYLIDAATGDELQEWYAPDAAANDRLGTSIALDGGRLAIGAERKDAQGDNSGAGYVVDLEPEGCAADLVGDDAMVDVEDLLVLLAAWQTDGPGADLAAPTDVVDVSDLLQLLAAWGPCPG